MNAEQQSEWDEALALAGCLLADEWDHPDYDRLASRFAAIEQGRGYVGEGDGGLYNSPPTPDRLARLRELVTELEERAVPRRVRYVIVTGIGSSSPPRRELYRGPADGLPDDLAAVRGYLESHRADLPGSGDLTYYFRLPDASYRNGLEVSVIPLGQRPHPTDLRGVRID